MRHTTRLGHIKSARSQPVTRLKQNLLCLPYNVVYSGAENEI